MKILTSEQIRQIDAETIKREDISSLQLMKRAATAFYEFFMGRYPDKNRQIAVFAGTGNNGGDALVVARMLHKAGYRVRVFIVESGKNCSEDCAHNIRRMKVENIHYSKIREREDIPDFSAFEVVVDGIFGTGLSREVKGIAAVVIGRMNDSGKRIVSIDLPSGLYLDRKTVFAVRAAETVTFQIPKLSLYLPENAPFVGEVFTVGIGLNEEVIAEAESDFTLTEPEEISRLLKPLLRSAHKGTQGHALIIGGSFGKCGSVILSSKAALKSGCGLVTAFLPRCGMIPLQSAFPEAMGIADTGEERLTGISYDLKPDAVGIGMGMGMHEETQRALRRFLQENDRPLVMDADALNILSRHEDWLSLLPRRTILTPHPRELRRLMGDWNDDFEKIEKCIRFSQEHEIILVVKGSWTLIVDGEKVYVNSSGSPALATAGSGDVLTGIITGLLAQGYCPVNAARVGVFLHGLAAQVSLGEIHPRSFVASDIIDNLGLAYRKLEKKS